MKANFLTFAYRATMLPNSQVLCIVDNGNGVLGLHKVTVLSVECSLFPSAGPCPDTMDSQMVFLLPPTCQALSRLRASAFAVAASSETLFTQDHIILFAYVFVVCPHVLG